MLKAKNPSIKKPSVATTVMRLKGDVLVEKGPGPRGPLYGLATASTAKPTNGVHTTR